MAKFLTSMKEIVATPTSLRIGDQEIPLRGKVGFRVGSYERMRGPVEFYWNQAQKLARERGIDFDKERFSSNGEHYFFGKKSVEFSFKTTPKIPCHEVEATIPEYVKFLRIKPSPTKDWVPIVLKPLEERINALGLEGLRALVSTRPSNATRGPRDPIPTGVKLALLADYTVTVKY